MKWAKSFLGYLPDYLIVLFIFAVSCGGGQQQRVLPVPITTLYVAPSGNDSNPGTQMRPLATVGRARDIIRSLKKTSSGEIIVYLRRGRYFLSDTLEFNEEDSGIPSRPITYKAFEGETVSISGGSKISGWQVNRNGRWSAATAVDNFRQLYVNGARVSRGRRGPLADAKVFGDLNNISGVAGFETSEKDIAGWQNQVDIELGFFSRWNHSICGVDRIAPSSTGTGSLVIMKQPCFYLITHKEGIRAGLPDYVENAMELMQEPGDWYLDRPNHIVYYWPKTGEDMTQAEVIAPNLQTLLRVRGTIEHPVHDIRFQGITFEHSNWLRPSQIGHPEMQANFIIQDDSTMYFRERFGATNVHNGFGKSPGAVVIDAASNIIFERCAFTRLGGAGLDLQHGAQSNLISGSKFSGISGNAIQVGDVLPQDHHPDDPRLSVKDNIVSNNLITNVASEYQGGVAVFVGYTNGTIISHNDISQVPYTAVSLGWGWGEEDAGGGIYPEPFIYEQPTTAKNNRVEFNHIHSVMMNLVDGAGIYTLSSQPGTVIRRNYVHDNPNFPGGIYLDEGSAYIEVSENAIAAVTDDIFFNNYALNRNLTCNVHDTFSGGDEFQAVILQAGLQPQYLDLLN